MCLSNVPPSQYSFTQCPNFEKSAHFRQNGTPYSVAFTMSSCSLQRVKGTWAPFNFNCSNGVSKFSASALFCLILESKDFAAMLLVMSCGLSIVTIELFVLSFKTDFHTVCVWSFSMHGRFPIWCQCMQQAAYTQQTPTWKIVNIFTRQKMGVFFWDQSPRRLAAVLLRARM